MTDRYEHLVSIHPELFETEREEKLPVWARLRLNKLRDLLMHEAGENDLLREETETRMTKP